MKKVILRSNRERSVLNFHPWIFSGAVYKKDEELQDGDIVEVYNAKNEYLATGHYYDSNIAVRIFDFEQNVVDYKFWENKIITAHQLRKTLGLTDNTFTNAYRLIHGETDGMPGLIVDIYNNVAVIQCQSVGMFKIRQDIAKTLQNVLKDKLNAIYCKSSDTLDASVQKDEFLYGYSDNVVIKENNYTFNIDFINGQKTGFFLDQRENRRLFSSYCKEKTVLDAFCYTGGFSVYAIGAKANSVESVDSSKQAISFLNKNITYNFYNPVHKSEIADCFDYFMGDVKNKYDVIVLDPPAFAKHIKDVRNASYRYKKINALAIKNIRKQGVLFTFSCSQPIDKSLFRKIIFYASSEAKRNVKILHQLTQPPDHPISIYHPEGEYLKGLVLYVE